MPRAHQGRNEPASTVEHSFICWPKQSWNLLTSLGNWGEVLSLLCRLSKLLRIVGLPLMGAAFFSLTGGHWVVLQTVAWAQMLHDYSRTAPIAEAIERTFSGDYPCTMCIKIGEGQQKEGKAPATVKLDKKTEVFLPSTQDLPGKPKGTDFSYTPLSEMALAKRCEAPPAPIPILA